MNVAIIKKDMDKPLVEDNVKVILQVSVLEDHITLRNYSETSNYLVFDVTNRALSIMEYVKQLREVALRLDIHVDILDWLLRPTYQVPNITDTFPELEYCSRTKSIDGYYANRPYVIKLDDCILSNRMMILDNFRRNCSKPIYKVNYYGDDEFTEEMVIFLKEHSYDVSKEIYKQISYVEIVDNFNCTSVDIPGQPYGIHFTQDENIETSMIHITSNMDSIAYVGGLTYRKLLGVTDTKSSRLKKILCDEANFRVYMRAVLDELNCCNLSVTQMYGNILTAMKPYITDNEIHTTTEGLNKIIEEETMTDTNKTETLDIEQLKWLLLYIMDTQLKSKVAHGLPVYLYKDMKHGVTAIFNYWSGLPYNVEMTDKYTNSYIDFVEQYARYNMIVVTDIITLAKEVDLDAYAAYIGGDTSNIRLIISPTMKNYIKI